MRGEDDLRKPVEAGGRIDVDPEAEAQELAEPAPEQALGRLGFHRLLSVNDEIAVFWY